MKYFWLYNILCQSLVRDFKNKSSEKKNANNSNDITSQYVRKNTYDNRSSKKGALSEKLPARNKNDVSFNTSENSSQKIISKPIPKKSQPKNKLLHSLSQYDEIDINKKTFNSL